VTTATLSDLETDGVVDRRVIGDQPVRVEYALTALKPAIEALQMWGDAHA